MGDTSVIREFLVLLGYKSDEPALKKFEGGIGRATKAVFSLAAAIEGTAVLVAAGVARFSSNLETLYFSSQRVGASATNIKAFDLAAQNLGATAGEAQASLEGLAHALRVNPGNAGMIEGLGVHLRDAHGHARDLTDVMLDLGKVFAKQPMFVSEQYSGSLGITERTMLAMRSGSFGQQVETMRKRMRDNGFDKAAADAHRFMSQLRDLEAQLEVFGAQVSDALEKKLGMGLKGLNAWIQKNGPWLAKRLVDAATQIITAAEFLGRKLEWLVGKLKALDEMSGGLSTKLIALGLLLKVTGGFEILGGILGLSGAFLALARNIDKAAAAGGAKGLLGKLGKLGMIGAAAGGGWELGSFLYDSVLSDKTKDRIGALGAHVMAAFGSSTAEEALRVNNPTGWRRSQQENALSYFQMRGWSPQQSAGIVANLDAESGMNPAAVGDHGAAYGLGQFHAPLQALFKKWFGIDIQRSTREQQLAFVNWDLTEGPDKLTGALMRAAQAPDQVARIMSLKFERPKAGAAEADRRGAAAVKIDSRTTIHVDGSRDPRATARATAAEQNRVNANLTRTFAAVVR